MNNDRICSVIILFNNSRKLSEAKEYLNKQVFQGKIELIEIDNSKNKFSSSSQGLNFGARKATGDVLIFMHQDINLIDINIIQAYYNRLISDSDTIAGCAGVLFGKKGVYTNILDTEDKIHRGINFDSDELNAETLDECFFGMSKKLYSKIQFDEINCPDWHLYCVDLCYQNYLAGNKNVILPYIMWHNCNSSSNSDGYWNTMKLMVKKYSKCIGHIHTTCESVSCNRFIFKIALLKRCIYNVAYKMKYFFDK